MPVLLTAGGGGGGRMKKKNNLELKGYIYRMWL